MLHSKDIDPAMIGRLEALLEKVARLGTAPDTILDRAMVPHLPLKDRGPSISLRLRQLRPVQLTAVYREALMAIGKASSRADRKPHMHPDEFRLMCHCVISCTTLRDVITRQIMFFNTRADSIAHIALTEDGARGAVEFDTLRRSRLLGGFLSDLAGMVIYRRLYAWLIAVDPATFDVQLSYDRSFADEPIEEFLTGPLYLGEAVNAVSFPRSHLDMPILRTAAELDRLLALFPLDFLAHPRTHIALNVRIVALYTTALEQGRPLPTMDELAHMQGWSVATLKRRLKASGLLISALKHEARMAIACRSLSDPTLTIEEVAARSGYKDGESFRTAFRRFSSLNPATYRRAQLAAGRAWLGQTA